MPYAKNGDVSLYYEVHGNNGPGLVFAHGAGGNATSWWQQIPEFRDRYRIVSFDHRGFARSPCAEEAQSALFFEHDLIAILDAADLPDAVIVCQSMGGWTGVRAAVNYPDRVRAVLLANTPGAISNAATQANTESLIKLVTTAGLGSTAISAEFVARCPERALLYQQIAAYNTVAKPNILGPEFTVTPQAVIDSKCPFGVLASDLDPLFPDHVLESVAADIGAECFRVYGAGHSTYFEKPEAFNSILNHFLHRFDS
ncbi:MAG: alpha/beta hydrolase [Proteobacteria bacterium]|nr:alpha/beta hydrolase [Pseudomonadota bacterium]